ncbi:MAG: flagellar basal-body rod protein FlgF [Halobacteriovoraceae bacterium]|nr:flagellar basal-body rod protein FlgF [Halobacteriovoraceae bacterium]
MQDIWVPVSGAIAQQRNVETIANNVANAKTPGFKKDRLAFKEYLSAFEKGVHDIDLPKKEWSPEDFYHSYGAEHGHVKVDGTYTMHRQGQLTPTGNPLDLAMTGPGFFEVWTPGGVRYTRRGLFSVSSSGQLITDRGDFVLSKGREAPQSRIIKLNSGKIKLNSGRLTINAGGDIFINGNKKNTISIVEFNDVHTLKKEGDSNFINTIENNLKANPLRSRIQQGFIEESNVNAISEMSNLIKANRHFESIQKVIKAYDNITGKSINEIAKF